MHSSDHERTKLAIHWHILVSNGVKSATNMTSELAVLIASFHFYHNLYLWAERCQRGSHEPDT